MENEFENDLFSMPELWPEELKEILDRYGEEFASGRTDQYKLCREMQREVNQLGYDFDWGLDGEPFNLRDTFGFLEQQFYCLGDSFGESGSCVNQCEDCKTN